MDKSGSKLLVASFIFPIGAVVHIVYLPIAAIAKGRKGVNDWLKAEAILLLGSTIPIVLRTLKRNFNTKKKWTIKRV